MADKSPLASIKDALRPLLPRRFRDRRPVVPVVRLSGAIGAVMPLRTGLSIAGVAPALERAFATPRARAVAIVINSPGGSAVQSHLIYRRIRDHAAQAKLPVVAFVEDAAASGGYMIACAADEIFADPSSLVGSIGVVSAGFGLDRLIERFGIERRVHTAGESKSMLDPFRPEDPRDIERLKGIQGRVHTLFKGLVRERRGAKLVGEDGDLFTGEVWTGAQGLEIGLVDGLGDIRSVMRARYGDEVQLRLIPAAKPSLVARWLGRGAGPQVGGLIDPAEALGVLEERAAWARLGL
jgi:signal peptide peptidase SppA